MPKRICKMCDVEFYTKHSRQICCSSACSRENRRKNESKSRKLRSERPYNLAVYTCSVCEGKFNPSGGKQKTCSKECSRIYMNNRKREYRKNNPEIFKAIKIKSYLKDPDRVREVNRKSYWKHVEKNRKRMRNKPVDYFVKSKLKSQLGTEPPADLVEEATALRLLNRALRNLG